jgi:hypothetical protein
MSYDFSLKGLKAMQFKIIIFFISYGLDLVACSNSELLMKL